LRVRLRLLLRSTRPSPFYLAAFYNGGSWQAIAALPPHRTTWPRRARSAVREGLRRAGQLAYGTVRVLGVRSLDRRVARGQATGRWQEAPNAVLRWIGSHGWAPGHGCGRVGVVGLAHRAHARTDAPDDEASASAFAVRSTKPRRAHVAPTRRCRRGLRLSWRRSTRRGACGVPALPGSSLDWMARETAAGLAAIVRMRAFNLERGHGGRAQASEPPFRSLISGVASLHTRRG